MNLWGIFFCFVVWTSTIGLLGYASGVEDERERQKKRANTHGNGYKLKSLDK